MYSYKINVLLEEGVQEFHVMSISTSCQFTAMQSVLQLAVSKLDTRIFNTKFEECRGSPINIILCEKLTLVHTSSK